MQGSNIISAVDIFCGIGGLSYGLKQAGISVEAGIDLDTTCKYAYENNVKSRFIGADVSNVTSRDIAPLWNNGAVRFLVGCAPCQPFSAYSNKVKGREHTKQWNLLCEFQRLVGEMSPHLISMENVPNLANKDIFKDFVSFLKQKGYYVSYGVLFCPDYGIPQNRKRLVLLASIFSDIDLPKKTHKPEDYNTVRSAIGHLPKVEAGEECKTDPMHRVYSLEEINLSRIKQSKPGGTWLDWDEHLQLACHKRQKVKSYKSVYGRMYWDKPSPTLTTAFCNYGAGRFGHPEQNRAITLREGALIQTFPEHYKFLENWNEMSITALSRHIGNAVPVTLGKSIGESVYSHVNYNI